MNILLVAKRRYTNQDLLTAKFGRLYRLPSYWVAREQNVRLVLLEYKYKTANRCKQDGLDVLTYGFSVSGLLGCYRFIHDQTWVPDIVIGSGDIHFGWLAKNLARKFKVPFVFDVYDQYESFSVSKLPGMKRVYRMCLVSAQQVWVASNETSEFVKQFQSNVQHIANGVDSAQFLKKDKQNCRRAFELDLNAQIVGYFGSMEPDRGVDDLIRAVEILSQRFSNILLLIAGRAPAHGLPEKPWIKFLGHIPHQRMPELIGACDVVTIPYRLSPFMDQGASCKITEYMACSVPIVTTKTPNFYKNFPEEYESLGEARCEAHSPIDMARAIEYQLSAQLCVKNVDTYTWESIGEKTLQALAELNKCSQLD